MFFIGLGVGLLAGFVFTVIGALAFITWYDSKVSP